MKKLAKIIRIITVAPIMALVMLIVIYLNNPLFFGNTVTFILIILFLVILPLAAYPLQPLIKGYKDRGREGQRTLAIIFAVAGYVFGCVFAIIFNSPRNVCIIYFAYLLSGALVMLSSKALHFNASGHACGITGPSTLLVYFGRYCGFIGIPILVIAWVSSIYMKRHTTVQFIAGAIIPLVTIGIISIVTMVI